MSSLVSLPKLLTILGRTGPGSRLASKFTDAPASNNMEKFRMSVRDIFYDVAKLDNQSLEMLKKGSDMSKGMALSIRFLNC